MMKAGISLQQRSMAGLAAILSLCFVGAAAGEEKEGPKKPKHTNRLIKETSPYLLRHARNPVDWYPWSEEAFQRAKEEKKPIFLSIGFSACHWCHRMERENFENEEIAAILNANFVSILVDREERPDIDDVFMTASLMATGGGGWPMSIFMTVNQEPFHCATYVPPETRGAQRGFRDMLLDLADRWKNDRYNLIGRGQANVYRVEQYNGLRGYATEFDRAEITRSVHSLAEGFDPEHGGTKSRGSKFPPSLAMELMLREFASRKAPTGTTLLELVKTTLRGMASGGIYDQLGGGIFRYSTDPAWFAPRFEKMLYDQAAVSGVYLSAFQLTHEEFYGRIAREILDYCLADLQAPGGGFYASRDAESEGEDGKYYVWHHSEIPKLLPQQDAALFNEYFSIRDGGNWLDGKNILHTKVTDEEFARRHNMSESQWPSRLDGMKRVMLRARAQRAAPPLDDKIVVEWNGLLITQLARAYRIFNEPRYRDAAVRAADFILGNMILDDRLYRVHRGGKTYIRAFGPDHVNMVEALITLYETTFDRKWLAAAKRLSDTFAKNFFDAHDHGFYVTPHDGEKLIVRSKSYRDGVVPSVNSVAALNFLRLWILLDDDYDRYYGEETLKVTLPLMEKRGMERAQWAGIFYLDRPKEIAIIGDPADPATQALIAEAYRNYYPNKIVASCRPEEAASDDALPLLKGKTLVNGKPGAYVCRNYVCDRPVNTPADLAEQLKQPGP